MNPEDIQYLIVHCSATPPSLDIGRKEIDAWHRRHGWNGIGYHKVIRRDGTVEQGRPEDRHGAHCSGLNSVSLGICLVGGVTEKKFGPEENWRLPEANFSDEQYDSLRTLLFKLLERYPGAEVVPHNQFANKACPSFPLKQWWALQVAGRRPE